MENESIQAAAPELQKYNKTEEEEKKIILREYRALLRSLKESLKKGDRAMLRHAFEMSAEAHKDMRRKSGEPYILHPLAVARIVVEDIGLGVTSAICALLHDTVEDTKTTYDELVENFGKVIADIVMECSDDKSLDKITRKMVQIMILIMIYILLIMNTNVLI